MKNDVKTNKLNTILLSVQKGLRGVVKDNDGAFSKYATLIKVMNTIQKPLNDAGVLISQGFDLDADKDIFYIVTNLIHSESGESLSNKIGFPMYKKDPHSIAGLSTYGRRYGLMSLLGLAPMDDDGMSAMGGGVTDEQKAEYQEILQHPLFDGKKTATNDWWKTHKTKDSAENALEIMRDKVTAVENADIGGADEDHSEEINAELDEQMNNAIQGDK